MKHYLIRPTREVQFEGVQLTPDDKAGHIITNVDLFSLCSGILYGQLEAVPIEDDAEPAELESSFGEGAVGDAGAEESTDSAPAVQSEPEAELSDQDETLEEMTKLVDYYRSIGLKESTAESLTDAVFTEDSIPDRDLLRTASGIKQWIEKHEDLTTLPRIGKTRAEEIMEAISK